MTRRQRRTTTQPGLRVLTAEQESELLGGFAWLDAGRPGPDDPAFFESAVEMREAWRIHGKRITSNWETPFRRPRGWWLFDREEPYPSTAAAEMVRLLALDRLTHEERRDLEEHVTPPAARFIAEDPAALANLDDGAREVVERHA